LVLGAERILEPSYRSDDSFAFLAFGVSDQTFSDFIYACFFSSDFKKLDCQRSDFASKSLVLSSSKEYENLEWCEIRAISGKLWDGFRKGVSGAIFRTTDNDFSPVR